jgi:hypothetical protein
VIQATGIGRPPQGRSPAQARLLARRAAEVVALRNLATELAARDRTAAGGRASTGTFRRTTYAQLRGFRYLPPKYLPDGRVEVTVEMPLVETKPKAPPAAGARSGRRTVEFRSRTVIWRRASTTEARPSSTPGSDVVPQWHRDDWVITAF